MYGGKLVSHYTVSKSLHFNVPSTVLGHSRTGWSGCREGVALTASSKICWRTLFFSIATGDEPFACHHSSRAWVLAIRVIGRHWSWTATLALLSPVTRDVEMTGADVSFFKREKKFFPFFSFFFFFKRRVRIFMPLTQQCLALDFWLSSLPPITLT